MWQQSIGVAIDASGLSDIDNEFRVVNDFIDYVYSCLNPNIKEQTERMADRRDLGLNKENGRLEVLLPEHLSDIGISFHRDQCKKFSVPENQIHIRHFTSKEGTRG